MIVPIVHDCCVPETQPPPCHGAKHPTEQTCDSNQKMILQKGKVTVGFLQHREFAAIGHVNTHILVQVQCTAYSIPMLLVPVCDIYLRNNALLI
jgi:hypothetical protein